MMPMFLQRSNGTVLGTVLNSFWGSEIDLRRSLFAFRKSTPFLANSDDEQRLYHL